MGKECKDCGTKLHSTASTCLNCGSKNVTDPQGVWWCALVLLVALGVYWVWPEALDGQRGQLTAEQTREQDIEESFLWGAEHYELTKYIKKRLKDPGSYKHVETNYTDKDDYLLVSVIYRSKNSLGVYVPGHIIAKCAIKGRVLDVIKHE